MKTKVSCFLFLILSFVSILTALSSNIGGPSCFRNVKVKDHPPLAKMTGIGMSGNFSLDDDTFLVL